MSNSQNPDNLSQISIPEAIFAILLTAARSDEALQVEEKLILSQTIERLSVFRSVEVADLTSSVIDLFAHHEVDSILVAAASMLDYQQKSTVFAIVVDLLIGEGLLHQKELLFIHKLEEILEINSNLSKQIIQVLLIKNRQI